ncbi:asparagine synthase-related protein [Stenotrophomonas sp. GD03908]|uniref:asparagine synthase (glutamine-hydrolyzing) n=1 Tax=Stenotrophomonas maltophilia TaxID=40324 RepID=A0AAJ2TLN8_STEMA|nr:MULTISPECIES: asparagine synthetase B family protein [Stenotrophomonas]MBH1481010.1 asparagine synthetase B family protein [Stenotrophomonas maltophilia]MDH0978213.1 asparagine synthase-related protein [Stenotrophomonas sp. GD03908]MDQ7292932.1 asparagine synthase-related protein [Stenotrophomonas sp. Sm0041]MDZ5763491.1 asparagine synthase-related protein [Stenotrophomonas maltophilia]
MYRYIAVLWNTFSESATAHAGQAVARIEATLPGASCVMNGNGAAIYAQTDNPGYFECNRSGSLAVLGALFHKHFGAGIVPERVDLDADSADSACSTLGRSIVERYWGRYVAFGYQPQTASWFVLRDPTAEIPCYMTTVGQVTIVFSNMEDCLRLGLRDFSVDWSFLSYSLLYPFRDGLQTGFEEVTSVEPGEAVSIRDGEPAGRQCQWDVVRLARDQAVEDIDEAVQLARSTLLGCIGALAGQHRKIQLQLSGGLDSSIILAGLLHAPSAPEVTCVHHYDDGIGADERRFARMAVEGARQSSGRHCEFIEYRRQPHCALEEIMSFPRTARPAHCSGYLLHRRDVDFDGDTVQFTGVGGDAVFLRFKGNAAAIDYAWRRGIDRGFFRVAFETAQSGDSLYGVLRDALVHGLLRRPASINGRWGKPCPWVRVECAEQDGMQPAWLRHALEQGHHVSPYKLAHIGRMIFPTSVLDPFEGVGRWHGVSPISAQPLVELFARLPLHLLMADAEDRTIARRALNGLLPEALLSRKVKSYLDDHSVAVTQGHQQFISSLLVDGFLARRGYLDSALADAGIRRVSPDHSSHVLGIFGPQINIEAWLRRWSGQAGPQTVGVV